MAIAKDKTMTLQQYAIAITFGLALVAGQILFKIAATQTTPAGETLPLIEVLFTWPMILALTIYGLTVILYIILLQDVPLSRAYMFSLGASALVPILAVAIFKEPMNARYIVGAILVFAGVILSTSS